MLGIDFASMLEEEIGEVQQKARNEWSEWTIYIGTKGKMYIRDLRESHSHVSFESFYIENMESIS